MIFSALESRFMAAIRSTVRLGTIKHWIGAVHGCGDATCAVRSVAAGQSIGYGRTFTAERDMRIGIVASGMRIITRARSGNKVSCSCMIRVPIWDGFVCS
jgi:hypothetical protein